MVYPAIFKTSKEQGKIFTIGMLDLDYFKRVNDTYGHPMGDQVLTEFAQYIKSHIRGSDVIYRYGGEEFAIVFPRTTSEEAKMCLKSVNSRVFEKVFNYENQCFSVSFSAGIFAVEDETITIDEALRGADDALYEAKRLGRARVESCIHYSAI